MTKNFISLFNSLRKLWVQSCKLAFLFNFIFVQIPPIYAQDSGEENTKFMKMSAEECQELSSREEKRDCLKNIGAEEAGIGDEGQFKTGAEVAKNLITAARMALTVINLVATKQSGGKSCKSQKLFMASGLVDMASQLFVTFYSKKKLGDVKKDYEDLYISKKSDKAQTAVFEFLIKEQEVVIHVSKHQRNAYALNVGLYGISMAMAIYEMTPFGAPDACVGGPTKDKDLAKEEAKPEPKPKAQEKVAPKKEVAKKDYLKRSSKDYSKHAKGKKADYSNVKSKIKVDKSKSFGQNRDANMKLTPSQKASMNPKPTVTPKTTVAPKPTVTPKPVPKKPAFKIPTYKKADYSGVKSKINSGIKKVPFLRIPKKELEKVKEFKEIDPLFHVDPDELAKVDIKKIEKWFFNQKEWNDFNQKKLDPLLVSHLKDLDFKIKDDDDPRLFEVREFLVLARSINHQLFSFLIPSAHAMPGLSQLRKGLGKVAAFFQTSPGIAILCGMSLTFASILLSEAVKQIKRSEKNIDKVREMLAQMDEYEGELFFSSTEEVDRFCYSGKGKEHPSRGELKVCQDYYDGTKPPLNGAVASVPTEPNQKDSSMYCRDKNKNVDEDCKCRDSNSCYSIPLSLFMASGSLGNALAPTAKPLAGSTNSVLSSPGTASKLNVNSLNKAAARLKKVNKKMISMINKMRKRKGLTPLPKTGNKIAKKFMDSIMSPENLNWVNRRTFGVMKRDQAPSNPSLSRKMASLSRKIGLSPVSRGIRLPMRVKRSVAEVEEEVEVKEDKSYMEKKYRYKHNDIIQKREILLFKIISSRYLRSLKKISY